MARDVANDITGEVACGVTNDMDGGSSFQNWSNQLGLFLTHYQINAH